MKFGVNVLLCLRIKKNQESSLEDSFSYLRKNSMWILLVLVKNGDFWYYGWIFGK